MSFELEMITNDVCYIIIVVFYYILGKGSPILTEVCRKIELNSMINILIELNESQYVYGGGAPPPVYVP